MQGEQLRDDHANVICQAAVGDCLLNNPFQSSLMEDWRTFNVIDICRNKTLFKTFAKVSCDVCLHYSTIYYLPLIT